MLKNKKYHTAFFIWLFTLIILVGSIIIVGGLTRLTDSGLSITKWELFKGILPPLNNQDWESYFLLYKEIPQYLLLNSKMTMDEFKYIFLWEYFHRLLARFIGLFFLIPFFFFVITHSLQRDLQIKLTNIFILILLQGAVGWFMVKSGLVDNVTVSHFRLSFHLSLAFIILSLLFWQLMNLQHSVNIRIFHDKSDYKILKILLVLIFFQIIFGAFVSGLDAGKIYQTWPLMNDNYFPNDIDLNNILNLNNPSAVQFIHRNIAYVIFFITIYSGYNILKNKLAKLYIPYLIFFSFIILQIVLGIFVLYSGVNIYLASMHQISSIFLVISCLNLCHRSIRS